MMNKQGQENILIVQPRRALFIFGGAGIVVLTLSFISQYIRIFPDSYNIRYPIQADLIHDFILEFNFGGLSDIAVYYNLLILNVTVFLFFVIAHLKNIGKDKNRLQWLAMAWIVLFFAIDNFAQIFKKIPALFKNTTGAGGRSANVWVIAVIIILVFVFVRFWLHLDNKYRLLFLISVALYFAGAFGMEIASRHKLKEFIYSLYLTIGQALQYGGVTLLIYSLLFYITSSYPQFFVSTNGGWDGEQDVTKQL